MPTLEEMEKLVSPDLLRKFAVEVGWLRSGATECKCPHCGAQLEFFAEGEFSRWRCVGKKAHTGRSLDLVMIGRGLSDVDAQALLAARLGLANYPANLPTYERGPKSQPRRKAREAPPSGTTSNARRSAG